MNRVKRFFARHEEKWFSAHAFLLQLLMLIAGTMLLLNAHTPLQMDDYDYAFSWSTGKPLSGVADVLASQAAHYRLWGGRSVVHTLTQLFLYAGKGAFNVANTAMYVLLVLELYALVRPKGQAVLLAGTACDSHSVVCARPVFRNRFSLAGRRV